ncbi:hypothetical protein ACPPVO_34885 [Dactylosporangium sp. McL0621]|uniref:hypothetical protein n=1 Tax=Dactylosporangium sp. McL0621 TaxID=3415678 RepID=UPI003CED0E34
MFEVDAAQFATLFHPCGRAVDTPGHLVALAEGDAERRREALGHLFGAVIHQGTPLTATGPAAVVVAGLIGDARLAGAANAELRAALLGFLAAVAEAGRSYTDAELDSWYPATDLDVDAALAEVLEGDDEEYWDIYSDGPLAAAVFRRGVLGCREATPVLLEAANAALDDPMPKVRAAAAHAVGACGTGVADLWRLERSAVGAGPDERASVALAIGALAGAPRAYLRDPHPGVRACAALAPALADEPAALDELLAALADPTAPERWFADRPPHFHQHIRFALIAAATERAGDPERLVPAAVAAVAIDGGRITGEDVVPFLRVIFADAAEWGEGVDWRPFTAAQRRYLAALVSNNRLWDGWLREAFQELGLPYDRDRCRELAHRSREGTLW